MTDPAEQRFAHVSFAALTDVGCRRENNEDAHGEWPAQGVFCVADGMGGAEDGEFASRTIVETLSAVLPRWSAYAPPIGQPDRLALLDRALNAASASVRDHADSLGKKGCGSTFVGIALDPGNPTRATALHAGDSRLYRIRGHRISQITRDHSVVNLLGARDERTLPPSLRSLVLRAVGTDETVELDRTPLDIAEHDWILLCSDGLSRMVSDRDIARIVAAAQAPEDAASSLVAAANEQGGADNITVILLRMGPAAPPPLPVHARLSPDEADALFGGIPFAPPRDETGSSPGRASESGLVSRHALLRIVLRRFFRRHRWLLPALVFLALASLAASVGFALARLNAGPVRAPAHLVEPTPPPLP